MHDDQPFPIYFVHHGETEWNSEHRCQGRRDSPVTAQGHAQVKRVVALLEGALPAPRAVRLVSSPLGRARVTAEIISSALQVEVATDARLAEVGLGDWEGRTLNEIAADPPAFFANTPPGERYFLAPGAESFDAAAARLRSFLIDCCEPTIAVGHGIAGRIMRGLYTGLTREEMLAQTIKRDAVFKLWRGEVILLDAL